MSTVCIVHSSDGASWFNYFSNYIKRVFAEATVESIQDSDLRQLSLSGSKVRTAILQSKVNIYVVSPGYMRFLIDNPTVSTRDDGGATAGDPRKTFIFLCGTTLDDFRLEDSGGQKVADRFPRCDKRRVLSHPRHDEMLEWVVRSLEPDSGLAREEAGAVGGGRMGKDGKDAEAGKLKSSPLHKVNGKRKRTSKSFKFIPSEVRCEGTSVVVISFDEQVAAEENEVNVEVEIDGDADADGPTKVVAVWHNPFTYSFTAPERRAGTFKAQLFLHGKVVGSQDLEYASTMADAITGLHLIYIHQINELCSVLNEKDLLTRDLDERISKVLRDDTEDLIPVVAFEYFHGAHRFQNSDASSFELPTMFHLAAKYGLSELGRQLTDLPDARHAYCIYNSDGKLPEELARHFDHPDLVTMFENFREGDIFQQLYDSYIIMNRVGQSNYLNSNRKADGEDSSDDYEDVPSELTFVNPFKAEEEKSSQLKDMEEAGMISKNYVEELENPYEFRFQRQILAAPAKFIESGPATSMPRNQQELVGIMEQVKNKQLTMHEAEVLFREWQIRHQKKPASVKQKEDQLAKMREEAEKTHKKDTFTFPHFLGKGKSGGGASSSNQCIPEIMPGTKPPPRSAAEVVKPMKPLMLEASATDRSSTTSSSSRESTCSLRSRASTTSGIDVDETIQEEMAPKLLPKSKANRQSVSLQKLEKELASPGALEPPPLPPRVWGPSSGRPPIPVSKEDGGAAAGVAPREKSPGADSSPDDSYIDCEPEAINNSVTSDDMYMIMEMAPPQQPIDQNDRSRSMIHQESMPEFPSVPYCAQPRKSSLPNLACPGSIPIPRIPFSGVPEEVEDSDSSGANPSCPPGRQFRLPMEGIHKKLKKMVPPLRQAATAYPAARTELPASTPGSSSTLPPPGPPKTKPKKAPPGMPQNKKQ